MSVTYVFLSWKRTSWSWLRVDLYSFFSRLKKIGKGVREIEGVCFLDNHNTKDWTTDYRYPQHLPVSRANLRQRLSTWRAVCQTHFKRMIEWNGVFFLSSLLAIDVHDQTDTLEVNHEESIKCRSKKRQGAHDCFLFSCKTIEWRLSTAH